jgi:flagellar protein FliJ
MIRQQLLTLLIEQSRRHRDEAAGVNAQATRQSRQAQDTLTMLQGYRRDYDQKAPKARLTPIDPALLPRHEHFVARLDLALGEQQDQTNRLEYQALQRRAELVDREKRLRAFELLQARQQAARLRRAEKRDQSATDEMAMQLALRKTSKKDPE